jgi:hypothetical protein
LCGGCTWCRCRESRLDTGAGEGVAEDAEHDARACVVVAAVKPAGIADQQALPGVEVDGLLVLEPVRGEARRTFPVSVKGVAVQVGKVLLLENERAEWELPDGKLELGEDPADCVIREIGEEAGWKVTAGPLLDC